MFDRSDGERVWLKEMFETDEEAARAYDAAVLKDGLDAQPLNFATRDLSKPIIAPPAEKVTKTKPKVVKTVAKTVAKTVEPKKTNTLNIAPIPLDPEDPTFGYVNGIKNSCVQSIASLIPVCKKHAGFERYYKEIFNTAKKDWASTSSVKTTSSDPRLYAIDCEMVLTQKIDCNKKTNPVSTLARLSLLEIFVQTDGTFTSSVVLDEYLKIPDDLVVVDYLTHVSGVTEEMLLASEISHDDIRAAFLSLVNSHDILIGHSLWSDYSALHITHENFVDTACLCEIRGLETLTLSLKDAASAVLQDEKEFEQFQKAGDSHDSVADAEWALRVLLRLLQLASAGTIVIPLIFQQVPERFKSRLTFHVIPSGNTEASVDAVLKGSTGDSTSAGYQIQPIRWHVRRDGSMTGSCLVEFPHSHAAKKVFDGLSVVQSGCGGYPNSDPCYIDGWPDRQSMPRKLVHIEMVEKPGQKRKRSSTECCEVISYFPTPLRYKKTMEIKSHLVGKVMGPSGRKVLLIQQTSGARVLITRQPDTKSKDKKLRETGELEISADRKEKMVTASELIHQAFKNKLKV